MLKVKDIVQLKGWSEYRVLRLINLGKLPAHNDGARGGNKTWKLI